MVDLMGLQRAASIEDLRRRAKRRIPRFAFDLVDGGAESERNLRRNVEAFEEVQLTPRYMVDVSEIDTRATLFGQTFDLPFGMAPIGMLNAFWPDADLILARLCASENIPYVASSAASTTLERLAEAAAGNGWFQLYVSGDAAVTESLVARAEAAGYRVMMVTADVPAAGKRDRDIRNQLSVPFRITPEVLLDLIVHPRWSLATLRHGKPGIANYADLLRSATSYADVQKTLITPGFTWRDLARLRERWRGTLLVKGVLHPQDALRCAELGCDGIVVSNHGGRQVAFGPPTIEALPGVAGAVGGRMKIILDSGVRRGA
ncbi:MAG: alpha-hydroxy-acid oxidizing enzyme, partial [Alphaproteobacteria bacterium HGW-Alphaproteobacteria-8]